ncbi:MAG TPA: hypothetical protein PLU17_05165 [Chitinophagaceae bacterium]|nr:hypothetical protein [Chitinophagaceae bacterium]
MEIQNANQFESIYNKYIDMLYGITLEIAPSLEEADMILIKTFEKIKEQNVANLENSFICITLIKLLIQSAHQVLHPQERRHQFKLKHFKNTPLLHLLICEQISIDEICLKNKLTHSDFNTKLREEFNAIRSLHDK